MIATISSTLVFGQRAAFRRVLPRWAVLLGRDGRTNSGTSMDDQRAAMIVAGDAASKADSQAPTTRQHRSADRCNDARTLVRRQPSQPKQ